MSDTDKLLEIAKARSYMGEEVSINKSGKFDVRPSTPLEAAYQRGQQAKALYQPRKNPYKLGTDEWGKWAEGYDKFNMPSPEELEGMKAALDFSAE